LETEDIKVDEKDNSGLTPLGYSILLSRVEYFNALLKFDNIKVKIANNGYDHMICEFSNILKHSSVLPMQVAA
jgi:hypothetical protein